MYFSTSNKEVNFHLIKKISLVEIKSVLMSFTIFSNLFSLQVFKILQKIYQRYFFIQYRKNSKDYFYRCNKSILISLYWKALFSLSVPPIWLFMHVKSLAWFNRHRKLRNMSSTKGFYHRFVLQLSVKVVSL